jgi:hypothetical protein
MMQTDVLSGHLNNNGIIANSVGRTRIRGISYTGTATAGGFVIWDTTSAPVAATYGRSGTTVTISSSAHGLTTGQAVGIDFAVASGSSATDGNYIITVVDANTFTVTDSNSGTIATSTVCNYVVATAANPTVWVTAVDTASIQPMYIKIPGEGIVIHQGIYISMTNLTGVTVYYG